MKTRLISLAICLIGAALAITLPSCAATTPSTQPTALTAQQQLTSIVADEQFAYAVAQSLLTGQALTDATAADAAFRASVAVVQAQIINGTVTPTQITTALADDVAAVKTIAAKVPKPVTTKPS